MKENLPPRDLVLMAIILTFVLFIKAYKVDQYANYTKEISYNDEVIYVNY